MRRFALFLLNMLLIQSCTLFEPEYQNWEIKQVGQSHSLTVKPQKDNNNSVVILYDGFTNSDYLLKVETFHGPNSLFRTDTIIVSNGIVKGEWRRDFYGTSGHVVITYIPKDSKAQGKVRIRTTIE